MKKYLSFTLLAAVAAVGLCVVANVRAAEESMDSKTESKLSANDKTFLKKAYKGSLQEIENAKVAKEKAQNEATKDIAERMITDHTKAKDQIYKMAEEENLDLAKVKVKATDASGDDFDKKYLTMLKKDHEKDIAMYEKEASDSGSKEDSDVKEFAKDTLPTLKEHLQMVEDALGKTK